MRISSRNQGAALGLVVAVATAACGPMASARAHASEGDVLRLAALTAAEVKSKLPPASSTVALQPMNTKGGSEVFANALDKALRSAGYAVAPDGSAPRGAEVVRYEAMPALNGYLVRLSVHGEDTARFYRANEAGVLVSAGPTTVREAD